MRAIVDVQDKMLPGVYQLNWLNNLRAFGDFAMSRRAACRLCGASSLWRLDVVPFSKI